MAPQDRHRVRIEAKKLRYGCEFFASLYAVDTPRVVTDSASSSSGRSPSPGTSSRCRPRSGAVNDHAHRRRPAALGRLGRRPAVDEHRLVEDAVDAVRALAALDPFWR